MIKTYVLDTNILLTSPNAIFGFQDNCVVITGTTLQELDSKKSLGGEIGYNARETCRILESLRMKGDLIAGVELPNGGVLRIVPDRNSSLPLGYTLDKPDNRIIATTSDLMKEGNAILITNDVSMRINATVCGLGENVESYKNDHVDSEEEYTGRCEIKTTAEVINEIYKEGCLSKKQLKSIVKKKKIKELVENEFVLLKVENTKQSVLCIYRSEKLYLIDTKKLHPYGITGKNIAQQFALYALMAPPEEIPFVILRGPAGTAKTFLALAAGLDATLGSKKEKMYEKVLISRNNVMADADFGYLPGELDEKMAPLLAPFYDNLESLIRGKNKKEDASELQMAISDLFYTKTIDICALAYMRGRSLTNSYLIVDECQNATRNQIRDIITRAGMGTKIVICGDPKQIDAPTLDRWNNGLVFAASKMKGSKLCAQIAFDDDESVRSELAREAIERLDL